jgi:hypothetical protein
MQPVYPASFVFARVRFRSDPPVAQVAHPFTRLPSCKRQAAESNGISLLELSLQEYSTRESVFSSGQQ